MQVTTQPHSANAKKCHIDVQKDYGYIKTLGPRCGQDKSEYDEEMVREVPEMEALDMLDMGLLCRSCAKYEGLLNE